MFLDELKVYWLFFSKVSVPGHYGPVGRVCGNGLGHKALGAFSGLNGGLKSNAKKQGFVSALPN